MFSNYMNNKKRKKKYMGVMLPRHTFLVLCLDIKYENVPNLFKMQWYKCNTLSLYLK